MQQFCRLNLPSKECIIVGDLGCASGPNTLASVKEIIELIDSESRKMNYGLPYIQVFLNDLESNDFNSIFKSLPLFYDNLEKYGRQSGSCFIAAMPGSFYGRLFPDHSIHFIHSSFSLHWLSQVRSFQTSGLSFYAAIIKKCSINIKVMYLIKLAHINGILLQFYFEDSR